MSILEFNDELLSAYLDGEVSPEEQAVVERALAESAEHRATLDDLRALRLALQSLPSERLDAGFAGRVLARAERAMLTAESANGRGDASGGNSPTTADKTTGGSAGAESATSVDIVRSSRASTTGGIPAWQTLAWTGGILAATVAFLLLLPSTAPRELAVSDRNASNAVPSREAARDRASEADNELKIAQADAAAGRMDAPIAAERPSNRQGEAASSGASPGGYADDIPSRRAAEFENGPSARNSIAQGQEKPFELHLGPRESEGESNARGPNSAASIARNGALPAPSGLPARQGPGQAAAGPSSGAAGSPLPVDVAHEAAARDRLRQLARASANERMLQQLAVQPRDLPREHFADDGEAAPAAPEAQLALKQQNGAANEEAANAEPFAAPRAEPPSDLPFGGERAFAAGAAPMPDESDLHEAATLVVRVRVADDDARRTLVPQALAAQNIALESRLESTETALNENEIATDEDAADNLADADRSHPAERGIHRQEFSRRAQAEIVLVEALPSQVLAVVDDLRAQQQRGERVAAVELDANDPLANLAAELGAFDGLLANGEAPSLLGKFHDAQDGARADEKGLAPGAGDKRERGEALREGRGRQGEALADKSHEASQPRTARSPVQPFSEDRDGGAEGTPEMEQTAGGDAAAPVVTAQGRARRMTIPADRGALAPGEPTTPPADDFLQDRSPKRAEMPAPERIRVLFVIEAEE